MRHDQFQAFLPVIASDIVRLIVEKENVSETAAIQELYSSKLFALLEQEDTKIWHYSTPMLYDLLTQEIRAGQLYFPDV